MNLHTRFKNHKALLVLCGIAVVTLVIIAVQILSQGKASENPTDLGDGYTKDGEQVYWNESLIEGADPGSFKKVGYYSGGDIWYSKDKDTVYLSSCVPVDGCYTSAFEGADADTFEFVPTQSVHLTKDKSNVYCGTRPMKFLTEDKLYLLIEPSGYDIAQEVQGRSVDANGIAQDSCAPLDEYFR